MHGKSMTSTTMTPNGYDKHARHVGYDRYAGHVGYDRHVGHVGYDRHANYDMK